MWGWSKYAIMVLSQGKSLTTVDMLLTRGLPVKAGLLNPYTLWRAKITHYAYGGLKLPTMAGLYTHYWRGGYPVWHLYISMLAACSHTMQQHHFSLLPGANCVDTRYTKRR